MTALKYNHNSLLLIRASHLVLLLLFVFSLVPWVHITPPRQREAQKLLHWDNKSCWMSARSSPCTPLPPSWFQQGFPHGLFSFLEEWGSLTHWAALGTFHVLLSISRKSSHFYYIGKKSLRRIVWVHLCVVPWMPKKGPQVRTSN